MSMESTRNSSNSTVMLAVGVVAFVVGILGIIGAVILASEPSAGNESTISGVLQSLLVICAAACTGLGVVLVTLGVIKRRRRDDAR